MARLQICGGYKGCWICLNKLEYPFKMPQCVWICLNNAEYDYACIYLHRVLNMPEFWICLMLYIYLFIYFQFIHRWLILFRFTPRLAFHKHHDLSQTPGAVSNIAECWYRWQQTFKAKSQFVVLIKVNAKQNRNTKRR